MSGISNVLRDIHRLRKHAHELQEQIDRAPVQLKAQKNKAAKAEAALADAQEALKKTRVAILDREATLKSTHQQIGKYERQKDEATDSKAYAALQHEIATEQQKAQSIENEILERMAATEEHTAKLPQLEAAKKKALAEVAAFEVEQKERLGQLAGELRSAMEQLKAAETQVPDDFRPQYQRVVNAYGADSLAAVEGQTCTHCHMQITFQQQHEVSTGHLICCKNCGRGLYLP
jgi:predicted  nucleic acid-binding Zn-ribbon protein